MIHPCSHPLDSPSAWRDLKPNLHTRTGFLVLGGAPGMGSTACSPLHRDTSGCVGKGRIFVYLHEYYIFYNYLFTVFAYQVFRLT